MYFLLYASFNATFIIYKNIYMIEFTLIDFLSAIN